MKLITVVPFEMIFYVLEKNRDFNDFYSLNDFSLFRFFELSISAISLLDCMYCRSMSIPIPYFKFTYFTSRQPLSSVTSAFTSTLMSL